MHLGLVRLRAGGVDLTTHLLRDEAELLADAATFFLHSLAEVLQMVGQTLLLLADVELLDVVNELLLEAVLVVVNLGNLLQTIDDALANLLHA